MDGYRAGPLAPSYDCLLFRWFGIASRLPFTDTVDDQAVLSFGPPQTAVRRAPLSAAILRRGERLWLDLAPALVPAASHPAMLGGNTARCLRVESLDA